MQVNVLYDKVNHPIDLATDALVSDLQNEIVKLLNIPAERQKLIFKGKQLSGGSNTLSSFNVKNKARLLLLADKSESPIKAISPSQPQGSSLFPGFSFNRGPTYLSEIKLDETIVAKKAPKGAIKGYNSQTEVLPTDPFEVYNENGEITYVSIETDAIFIRVGDTGDRIFLSEITAFGSQQIPDQQYFAMVIEVKGKRRWLYYLPYQYTAFFNDLLRTPQQ